MSESSGKSDRELRQDSKLDLKAHPVKVGREQAVLELKQLEERVARRESSGRSEEEGRHSLQLELDEWTEDAG